MAEGKKSGWKKPKRRRRTRKKREQGGRWVLGLAECKCEASGPLLLGAEAAITWDETLGGI